MRFNYTKSFMLIAVCGAAFLLAYELIAGLDPGRSGGSLGRLIVMPILALPFTLLADAVAAYRERHGHQPRRSWRARLKAVSRRLALSRT